MGSVSRCMYGSTWSCYQDHFFLMGYTKKSEVSKTFLKNKLNRELFETEHTLVKELQVTLQGILRNQYALGYDTCWVCFPDSGS